MDTSSPASPPGARAPRRHPAARAGFTVVEVMVATFVMLFAISSSILVMQSGFRSLDTARKTTLAAQIMQSEMEKIRMLNWTQVKALITNGSSPISLDTIFPNNTDVEKHILAEMERTFTATRTAAYVTGTDDQVVEIATRISWRGIDGVRHERTSSTRYCQNGLYSYYYTLNKVSS